MTKDEILKGVNSMPALAERIGKPVSVDRDGNTTLNGTYSIDELEAILSCSCMERACCGMGR